MDSWRFEKLTERQKECLRLLHQHYSAKQIGRKLDISPNTVNRHLQDARTLLGVSRSKDLAILLVEHEGGKQITTESVIIDPLFDVEDDALAVAPNSCGAIVRNRNPFGYLSRIGLIVAIAFGAVALAGATLVGSTAITQIFRAERIDISDYPYRQ